ncbi:uncharacterized protein N7498_001677 [Penicillium cinerascens]|uniref:Uncharacterized protein n=1 Tax=Penicillium cinerascens TaxID=70096 RepID=A0A9W9TB90_9EURO|nr:uncharacterized protein N7498_001677 [Penicillium cinerascens]KAJ5215270.1 hypothetical protein N7498_001677 [Penicillium cinerascens]
MEDIAEIVREIGRQQVENTYYRACYDSLKRLQDLVGQASEDLFQVYQYNKNVSSCDFQSAHLVAEELRNAIQALSVQEEKAQLALKELYTFRHGIQK